MYIDIVSDLHVEHWASFPYDWEKNKQSDVVVIAGDLSDSIDLTVRELIKACKVYTYVLFVDGNHESGDLNTNSSQLDLSIDVIRDRMTGFSNFFSLHHEMCRFRNIAFVGSCLWWNFSNSDQVKRDFSAHMHPHVIQQIEQTANTHADVLHEQIQRLSEDSSIDAIVVVTHTLPHSLLATNSSYPTNDRYKPMYFNSRAEKLFEYHKVKHFVFGHSHDAKIHTIMNKTCINNARGRPHDFNRQHYAPYTTYVQ